MEDSEMQGSILIGEIRSLGLDAQHEYGRMLRSLGEAEVVGALDVDDKDRFLQLLQEAIEQFKNAGHLHEKIEGKFQKLLDRIK